MSAVTSNNVECIRFLIVVKNLGEYLHVSVNKVNVEFDIFYFDIKKFHLLGR